jgi:hypothetical protein
MSKYSKVILGMIAATTVAAPIAITAASANAAPVSAAAPSATSTTVKYTGQGFTNGLLNTDTGGELGYILWVFNANGATSAKINLPDGTTHDMATSGNGFKFTSKYWAPSALAGVTVNYTGTAKNAVLTVSHGHAVDTPVTNTFDPSTGTGDIPRGDLPADAKFNIELTNDNATRWVASGTEYSRTSSVTQLWSVKATPILGDVTMQVVGWHLAGGDQYIKYVKGGYSGAPYVGYTEPGAVFGGFLPNVFTASYANLQLEDGTLVAL